jgi:hypothetical protein
MSEPTVLFAVSSRAQHEDVRCVAPHLTARALVLDLASLETNDDPVNQRYSGTHWPDGSVRRLLQMRAEVTRLVKVEGVGAVVLGQDSARPTRTVAAAARRCGAPTVVMPDGTVNRTPERLPRGRELTVDTVLRATRILAGVHGLIGGSHPDVVLSWGSGWDTYWREAAPRARIVDCGSPRSDALRTIDPPSAGTRTLVCSQPMWTYPFDAAGGSPQSWYGWVTKLVAASAPGQLRVRLHPLEAERLADLPLGPEVRDLLSVEPLAADLSWASSVVAPVSTVLVEAAGVGRPILAVQPEGLADAAYTGSPFFTDPQVTRVRLADVATWDLLQKSLEAAAQAQVGLGERYLSGVGSASAACAAAIELALGRRP